MNKIEIKNKYTEGIIFSYECKDNTVLKTLLKAIKENTDLRNTDLRNADLSNADLSNADLRNANLRNANLRNADLSNADLFNADLRNADLSNADLFNADLRNANLRNADLRNANLRNADLRNAVKVPLYCKWSIGLIGDKISIGCKTKIIKDWDLFFESDEEFETKRNTEEFKQIEACYNAYKSYYEFLNQ